MASGLVRATCFTALVGVATLAVVNCSYRFERTGMSVASLLAAEEPRNVITRGYRGRLLERETELDKLPSWLPVPLPYSFVMGLASVSAHARRGHPSTFFGVYRAHGSLGYFPTMLLIKTPAIMLLSLAWGAVLAVRRVRVRAPISLVSSLLGLSGLVLVALSMRASINIGVRHVLPVMPVMAVLAGRTALLELERLPANARGRAVALVCACAQVAGLACSFPDYLGDFNALVLGRYGGQRISIVGEEWGQDMVRLGRATQARGIRAIRYNPDGFTAALELARFDVRSRRFGCKKHRNPSVYVAVNARDLSRQQGRCYPWTRTEQPLFHVGGHVFVYGPRHADGIETHR